MLMRLDPFREMERMLNRAWGPGTSGWTGLPMDAFRRDDEFIVELDLPGIDPDTVEVTVERDVLEIKAERVRPVRDDDEVVVAERPFGTFTRQLFLGKGLAVDSIEAHYTDGVLRLVIPVAEESRPRRIQVAAGDGGTKPVEATTA
jgi:HSP20 family protein